MSILVSVYRSLLAGYKTQNATISPPFFSGCFGPSTCESGRKPEQNGVELIDKTFCLAGCLFRGFEVLDWDFENMRPAHFGSINAQISSGLVADGS